MTYAHEISMPKTKREGLENFVQIIINQIEAGETRNALLSAVDLLEDLRCGNYDDAMADAKGYSAVIREAQTKHTQEIIEATDRGYLEGVRAERARLATLLGVT